MATKKKQLIYFKFTRGWELFFIVLMLASLMALFQETSLFRQEGLHWSPHLISGITFSGIATFWITVIVFHIALFIVIARSVIVEGRNKTSNSLDYLAGFLAVVGIYFVLISTIYWLYKGQLNIEFLWNISSNVLLRLGFIIEALAIIWFGITE
jgi:hypothetical protein